MGQRRNLTARKGKEKKMSQTIAPFASVTIEQLKAQLAALPASDPRSPNYTHADGLTNREISEMADDHYAEDFAD